MSGFEVYPQASASGRLVGKLGVASQIVLASGGVFPAAAWGQILASVPSEGFITGYLVRADSSITVDVSILNVGAGASGAEAAILAQPFGALASGAPTVGTFPVPARVTAGTRLSIRPENTGGVGISVALTFTPLANLEGS